MDRASKAPWASDQATGITSAGTNQTPEPTDGDEGTKVLPQHLVRLNASSHNHTIPLKHFSLAMRN